MLSRRRRSVTWCTDHDLATRTVLPANRGFAIHLIARSSRISHIPMTAVLSPSCRGASPGEGGIDAAVCIQHRDDGEPARPEPALRMAVRIRAVAGVGGTPRAVHHSRKSHYDILWVGDDSGEDASAGWGDCRRYTK